MWIKTLRRGYLNTAHIINLRSAAWTPPDFTATPSPPLYTVEAVVSDCAYALTQPVPAERANILLQVIAHALANDSIVPGTFQIPFEPPTE